MLRKLSYVADCTGVCFFIIYAQKIQVLFKENKCQHSLFRLTIIHLKFVASPTSLQYPWPTGLIQCVKVVMCLHCCSISILSLVSTITGTMTLMELLHYGWIWLAVPVLLASPDGCRKETQVNVVLSSNKIGTDISMDTLGLGRRMPERLCWPCAERLDFHQRKVDQKCLLIRMIVPMLH